MDKLTRIFECFDPVWPKYAEWTASLFLMIAQTLLPEKNQNEVIGEYVNSLMVQSYNSAPPRYVEMDPNLLSWELLVLIYMNMIGFQFPVKYSYDPRMDDQKTWIRELLLRVLKHHSQETKKQYQYLMHLESRAAKFLQHWYPQICKFGLKTT